MLNDNASILVGKRFGRLTVVADSGQRTRSNNKLWYCRCVCGRLTLAPKANLVRGMTQSCGCLRRERLIERNRRRGAENASRTPEYLAWDAMLQRCYNPEHPAYKQYGERGVTVHEAWRNSFLAFLRDVGRRPSPRHVLERWPDPEGHYEPGNVRWATHAERAGRTSLLPVTIDGVTRTIAEWARCLGVPYRRIWRRIKDGMRPEDAVRLPHTRTQRATPDATGAYHVEGIVRRIGNNGMYLGIPASVVRALSSGRRRKRLPVRVAFQAVSFDADLRLDTASLSARLYLPRKVFQDVSVGSKIDVRVAQSRP